MARRRPPQRARSLASRLRHACGVGRVFAGGVERVFAWGTLLGIATGIALGAGPGLPEARADEPSIYLWTDEAGVIRYTTDPGRVPVGRRSTMKRVEQGMALPAPSPATKLPTAEPTFTSFPPPDTTSQSGAPSATGAGAAGSAGTPAGAGPSEATSDASSVLYGGVPAAEGGAGAAAAGMGASAVAFPQVSTPVVRLSPQQESRRRELEESIARDEEALKTLVSESSDNGADPLVDSPELREIARRLPVLQAELRALNEGRAPPEAR